MLPLLVNIDVSIYKYPEVVKPHIKYRPPNHHHHHHRRNCFWVKRLPNDCLLPMSHYQVDIDCLLKDEVSLIKKLTASIHLSPAACLGWGHAGGRDAQNSLSET